MGHEHEHGTAHYSRAFAVGVVLNLGFVVVEFLYGQLAHSLALVADAGHNLSDVLALLLAWGAVLLSDAAQRRGGRMVCGAPPSWRRSSMLSCCSLPWARSPGRQSVASVSRPPWRSRRSSGWP